MLGTKFSARYHFKFLVEATWLDDELKLTKVGSVLNQLGVEDHPLVDEFLDNYFQGLDWELFEEDCRFFFRVDLTLWRASSSFSRIAIKLVNSDSLLKAFLDSGGIAKLRLQTRAARRLIGFSFGFLPSLVWTPEEGFEFSLSTFFPGIVR